MNKPAQDSAQMADYLKARKLDLKAVIVGMAGIKKLNRREIKGTKAEILTVDAFKAEIDFIDIKLKRKRR